jgi:hypothetical protein
MEAVAPHLQKVQALVVEHAFTIGIGLLVAALVAGIAWYWMSRSSVKSDVLVNQARVNGASTDGPNTDGHGQFPASAMADEPPSPPSQEDMEKERAILAQMAADGQVPPVTDSN